MRILLLALVHTLSGSEVGLAEQLHHESPASDTEVGCGAAFSGAQSRRQEMLLIKTSMLAIHSDEAK